MAAIKRDLTQLRGEQLVDEIGFNSYLLLCNYNVWLNIDCVPIEQKEEVITLINTLREYKEEIDKRRKGEE